MVRRLPRCSPGLAAVCAIILAPAGLMGQSAGTAPAFEVASVKPADPKARYVGMFTHSGGRITVSGYTLAKLIEDAFDIQPFQISGGPRWIHEDEYDIEAKPPAASNSAMANPPYPKAPPNVEQRQMLQTLLIDRFHLQFHTELKDGPVYLLIRGNKDLKLQDPKDKDEYPWAGSIAGGAISGDGLAGRNESMGDLAKRLSPYLGRLVLDRTDLKGSFDFKYSYTSSDSRTDVISTILVSVQGIGLKLEPAKEPVQTWVIDRAEKPAAN